MSLSSAADVLVTGDERLAALLARVPLNGFGVAASLECASSDFGFARMERWFQLS